MTKIKGKANTAKEADDDDHHLHLNIVPMNLSSWDQQMCQMTDDDIPFTDVMWDDDDFISLITSWVRLRMEEPQTDFPMSFTWASHIPASMLMGC